MQDENDIIYNTYGFDLAAFIRSLIERVTSPSLADSLVHWWDVYSVIAILFSILLLAGIVYARVRAGQLIEGEMAVFKQQEVAWQHTYGTGTKKNDRWADIQSHIATENPSDWRLAIIEADIMLEEMLDNAGYEGVSIGDRLKSAPNSFSTINDAWEAHKVRNEIAHAGSGFVLTKKTAQDTIIRFERVFKEFDVV